jgi:DNA-directed RNA polymerase sigma subunit (sigma70/sigma32)
VHEQLQRIMAAQHRLRTELGRDASLEEVAEAVGLSEDKVSEIMASAATAGSLEVPALASSDGSASELKDMIMVRAHISLSATLLELRLVRAVPIAAVGKAGCHPCPCAGRASHS